MENTLFESIMVNTCGRHRTFVQARTVYGARSGQYCQPWTLCDNEVLILTNVHLVGDVGNRGGCACGGDRGHIGNLCTFSSAMNLKLL